VTWLTLSNFFTAVYAWSAVWLTLFVLVSLPRPNKHPADWEVIIFRASLASVCATVVFYRLRYIPPEALILPLLAFAYTSMATTVRVIRKTYKESKLRWDRYGS
jgi:hypothetical protein